MATLLAPSQRDSTSSRSDLSAGTPVHDGSSVVAGRAGSSLDGAEHCDGAPVATTALGDDSPGGLLVTPDGENTPVGRSSPTR